MKNLLLKHSSLLVIATGSFSFFLLNIVLRDFLKNFDYSLYSIFVTYLSLLISFGLLGTDYTFIRISDYRENLFFTNINFLKVIFSIIFIFSFIYTFIIWKIYFYNYNIFYILIITFITLINLLTYNILRLKSKFFLSQLINNFWRFSLLIIVLFFYLFKVEFSFRLILEILFFIFVITLLINFSYLKKLKLSNLEPHVNLISLSLQHLIANFILSAMNFFDRFIVERNFGMLELANYFFLSNIFLYPFFIFQNYIGFKEVVYFKKEITVNILKAKILKISLFSILFSVILFLFCFVIDYLGLYKLNTANNINIIILMLILGIIRNIYSILSGAGSALANPSFVKKLNLNSTLLLFSLLIPYYFNFSVELVLLSFISIWLIRVFIMFFLVKKEILLKTLT
ncbi:MAG: hypothetical protein KatS3mg068_0474 [Candidatus Sericytochromatia bacterium]|nr:MAG: hypothetical protein KatS3mg068_0474 [Candidatus Sericytochromatia bacterium]